MNLEDAILQVTDEIVAAESTKDLERAEKKLNLLTQLSNISKTPER